MRLVTRLPSLSTALLVPSIVVFALTAKPARLYAESAPPPTACVNDECADAEVGASCTLGDGTGVCTVIGACKDDAGTLVNQKRCAAPPVDAGPSKDAGDASTKDSGAATDNDGGAAGSTEDDDGGCNVGSGDVAPPLSAGFLAFVSLAVRTLRRRPRSASTRQS